VVKSSAALLGLPHPFGESRHHLVDIAEPLAVPSLAKRPHTVRGLPDVIREMRRDARIRTRAGRRVQPVLAGRAQTLHTPMAPQRVLGEGFSRVQYLHFRCAKFSKYRKYDCVTFRLRADTRIQDPSIEISGFCPVRVNVFPPTLNNMESALSRLHPLCRHVLSSSVRFRSSVSFFSHAAPRALASKMSSEPPHSLVMIPGTHLNSCLNCPHNPRLSAKSVFWPQVP